MSVQLVSWALTTLEIVKEYLGISDTDYDDLLNRLINSASSFIEKETDRKLLARDYDKDDSDDDEDTRLDGIGKESVFLRQYPVNSVSAVRCSGTLISAADDDDYYGSTGYLIYKRRGELYYSNGWDTGKQNIRVSYNAGYASGTPEIEELRDLCNSLVSWVYKNRQHLGFKMERIGNYQYSRGDLKEDWQREVINRYRRKLSG